MIACIVCTRKYLLVICSVNPRRVRINITQSYRTQFVRLCEKHWVITKMDKTCLTHDYRRGTVQMARFSSAQIEISPPRGLDVQ